VGAKEACSSTGRGRGSVGSDMAVMVAAGGGSGGDDGGDAGGMKRVE
jgi:hypothetical protein